MPKKPPHRLPVLPEMRCDDGCGDCCGPVPVTEEEYARVRRFARERNLKPLAQGITCPWYQGGRCAVHAVRPFPCRLFGHTDDMPCSRGYNVNIDPELEEGLVVAHGKPTRMLHEALGEGDKKFDVAAYLGDAIGGLKSVSLR